MTHPDVIALDIIDSTINAKKYDDKEILETLAYLQTNYGMKYNIVDDYIKNIPYPRIPVERIFLYQGRPQSLFNVCVNTDFSKPVDLELLEKICCYTKNSQSSGLILKNIVSPHLDQYFSSWEEIKTVYSHQKYPNLFEKIILRYIVPILISSPKLITLDCFLTIPLEIINKETYPELNCKWLEYLIENLAIDFESYFSIYQKILEIHAKENWPRNSILDEDLSIFLDTICVNLDLDFSQLLKIYNLEYKLLLSNRYGSNYPKHSKSIIQNAFKKANGIGSGFKISSHHFEDLLFDAWTPFVIFKKLACVEKITYLDPIASTFKDGDPYIHIKNRLHRLSKKDIQEIKNNPKTSPLFLNILK